MSSKASRSDVEAPLDGEVRKLYYSMVSPVDDGDETGKYGSIRLRMPIFVKCRERFLVELNCKNLCKLFDTKRADRHHETSEKSCRLHTHISLHRYTAEYGCKFPRTSPASCFRPSENSEEERDAAGRRPSRTYETM